MNFTKRYYAVFKGRHPGVYDDFNDAMEQVDGYEGAVFKSYASPEEAAEAYRRGAVRESASELGNLLLNASRHKDHSPTEGRRAGKPGETDYFTFPEIDLRGWAVDASCLGNPGVLEYRGVELMTGKELFRIGPFPKGTNNIGEFLAIVHALALMARNGETHTVYSDSVSGMAWVRNRRIKTQLPRNAETEQLFRMVERAMAWLNTHRYDAKILKWDTDRWGEIPADFGRKS